MNPEQYDFIIIGGGAAGFAAAIKAEALGKKTLMISGGKVPLGGTCINVGCMPSKYLLAAAESYHNARNATYEGLTPAAAQLDFGTVIAAKDALIAKLQKKQYAGTLRFLAYVTLKEGDARFVDANTVEVAGEAYRADKILISTGSSTFVPPMDGLEEAGYLTNIEALSLKELPKSLVILGGGPLGLEFAQIFSRFGSHVTLLDHGSRVAGREEPELSAVVQKRLLDEGVIIHMHAEAKSARREGSMVRMSANVDGKEVTIEAEHVLVASGVRANTGSLNLESAGVEIGTRGGIVTNEFLQSSVPHIYAAGDVVDEAGEDINPKLETVAGREGFIAASNALGDKKIQRDFRAVPHAIYTDPALGSVGMTEKQAADSGNATESRSLSLELVPKAHILGSTDGVIKMIIDKKTEQVLGVHMAGANADEIISMASFIVRKNLTLDDVIETTFNFPTMAESIKWVAQSFRKDVSKLSCCTE